jgi:hypothetical protein
VAAAAGQHVPWVAVVVELAPVEEVGVQLVPWVEEVEVRTDVVVVVPEVEGAEVDRETFLMGAQRTDRHHLTSQLSDAGVLGESTGA